jgi:phage shock protein PspC (stress-responsive transcriptional regulator)
MKKKLMRSRTDAHLAGVCGGLADYFNIDVKIIRILWVISAFFGGPSIGAYIICAIIIPKEPVREKKTETYEKPVYESYSKKEEEIKEEVKVEEDEYHDEVKEETYESESNDSKDDYFNTDYDDIYDSYNEDQVYDEPSDDYREDYEKYDQVETRNNNMIYLGLGLIALGAFLVLKIIFPTLSSTIMWPAILIIGGFLLLTRNNDAKENE